MIIFRIIFFILIIRVLFLLDLQYVLSFGMKKKKTITDCWNTFTETFENYFFSSQKIKMPFRKTCKKPNLLNSSCFHVKSTIYIKGICNKAHCAFS